MQGILQGVAAQAPHFRRLLLAAGAEAHAATEGWVANHVCWVLRKLHAYEAAWPVQLQGKLMTEDVMLDELQRR